MSKVFVYGTLRTGLYNYELYLKNNSTFVDYGYVKGTLYSLTDRTYPALIDGENLILGEIFEVSTQTLARLDELESYIEGNPNNEYNKIKVPIYNIDGTQIDLLDVYFYNDTNEQYRKLLNEVIAQNDYVKYIKSTLK